MKAKYIGKTRDRYTRAVHLVYEYRGREYIVTDEHNGYSGTLAEQHRREQERIDIELARPEHEEETNGEPNDAETGFDIFWKMVNG